MSVLEYSEYSSAGKVSNAKATNQGAGISYDDDATDADDADDDDTDADADADDYGEEKMDDCLMKVNTGVSSITLSAFRSPKFDIPLKKLCI